MATSRSKSEFPRRLFVYGSLLCVLVMTTLLLHMIKGQPLKPDPTNILITQTGFADALDTIFDTRVPVQPHRWDYVFVHQSKTPGGSALTMSKPDDGPDDHFVIGNGDECSDGELQMGVRWNRQLSAAPPDGAREIDPACISICVVGDFDLAGPTPKQLGRLGQLVLTLQAKFHISPDHVILMSDLGTTPAGLGRHFPATAFRAELYTRANGN